MFCTGVILPLKLWRPNIRVHLLLGLHVQLYLTLTALGRGPPRQTLPRTQNRLTFSRAASWLFSLKSYAYFDTKFAKIRPPVMESHDLLWPKVNPKSENFFHFVYKSDGKINFLFWPVNHKFCPIFALYIMNSTWYWSKWRSQTAEIIKQ